MSQALKAVDGVEILTLQDNYIDLTSGDGTAVVQRAMPVRDGRFELSVLAEHGFSALVTVLDGDRRRGLLFDFGLSAFGAAHNADVLGADLSRVEVAVLSHGHMDHLGGMKALVDKIGKQGLDLVVHPEAFRSPRFKKVSEDIRIDLPSLTRELIDAAGVNPVESDRPMTLLDDTVLFLGRVPRRTDFEQGVPDMRYLDDGEEKQDDFPDDTGIAINVKDHGLVVLTGCAHSGIVNTVHHAREASGEDRVLAVMGGFHLSGPVNADKVVPTIDALETFDPRYVVPTHCTGRSTINEFERRLPDRFLLNMAGTRLVWPA